MNCHACGREVPAESAFCPKCGARLDDDVGDGDGADGDANFHERSGAGHFPSGGAHGPGQDVPEEELWSGSYSPKAMVGPMVAVVILTVLGMIVGSWAPPYGWLVAGGVGVLVLAWLLVTVLYRKMTVRYRLTTHRFFVESGLLGRTDEHMQVIAIDDVTVRQGPIQRMSNVGEIILRTQDQSSQVLTLHGIEGARHVADLIDRARRAERNRRGLYMSNM